MVTIVKFPDALAIENKVFAVHMLIHGILSSDVYCEIKGIQLTHRLVYVRIFLDTSPGKS